MVLKLLTFKAKKKQGAGLFEGEKTGGEKRKRLRNMDSSDVNNYTGKFDFYFFSLFDL